VSTRATAAAPPFALRFALDFRPSDAAPETLREASPEAASAAGRDATSDAGKVAADGFSNADALGAKPAGSSPACTRDTPKLALAAPAVTEVRKECCSPVATGTGVCPDCRTEELAPASATARLGLSSPAVDTNEAGCAEVSALWSTPDVP